ncbi:MAG TPA: ABC transporter ATP-binding protein [Tenericutes bacterium]|nr:ABC transporter ATP-binding protein [Mycoplasmatota bacterium]
MGNIIEIKNVFKTYNTENIFTHALNNVDFKVKKGEIVVILGASGSGKTTLLNVISGLDKVTSGTIVYEGKDITNLKDKKITRFRKENLGFIFQTYNLLEHLNVYENVLVGAKLGKEKTNINEIIKTVGLDVHKHKYMHELSGGEQQRVSIARALAKNPQVMFCDEPTGALDEKTGKIVLESLIDVNEKFNTTMIIITHNPGIALIGDRIIKMNSGKIVEEIINEKRTKPNDIPWG